jgi:S-DNA-T family DNA segregation ATPase FtsK/SpoIIIE
LTVRENVGASGLYTLIVSSQHGRNFVVSRLQSKLCRIVGCNQDDASNSEHLRTLASRIYDETRLIAPRLALQAMGLSRVTEEIVGLAVARHLAEQHKPSKPHNGVVVWISLDDHPGWFSGISAIRADLLRITLREEEHSLVVDFLVVEGKLRQAYDAHGEDQVTSTLDLIQDTLPDSGDEIQPIDAKMWREHFAAAMEAVAPEARTLIGKASEQADGEKVKLPGDMRERFREGEFEVGDITGFFSLCRHDKTGVFELAQGKDTRLFIAKSYRNHVIDLVDLESNSAPLIDSINTGAIASKNEAAHSSQVSASNTEGVSKSKALGKTSFASPSRQDTTSADETTSDAETSKKDEHSPSKLATSELERRYQLILDTFGHFSINVNCPSDAPKFEEGPASVLYRVKPALGVDPKKLRSCADSLKLALGLEEDQGIRFSIHRGFSLLDVPKRGEERYFIKTSDLWKKWNRPSSGLEVPFGVDRRGLPVCMEFSSSSSPHLLVGGATGSGKSEALNTILYGLVEHYSPKELRLQLIDPKSTELIDFEDYDHLLGEIGVEAEDALALLHNAVEEMQRRYKSFRELRVRSISEYNDKVSPELKIPWWVIVLDEYADLTTEKNDKEEIESALKRLAQKARAAGIHVIIATQNPKAEVISTSLRSNLPAQLALQVRSSTESQIIMSEVGAETLTGKGDAFFNSGSKMIRVQCAIYDGN